MTTIAVRDETLELLKSTRQRFRTGTHDETIRKLIWESKTRGKNLRGLLKGVKTEFKREELDRFT